MNPEVDTILIDETNLDISGAKFFCGLEECAGAKPSEANRWPYSRRYCKHRISLSILAVRYISNLEGDFHYPLPEKFTDRLLESIFRELLIVLGEQEVQCHAYSAGSITFSSTHSGTA